MSINITKDKKVQIEMKDQISEAFERFENITRNIDDALTSPVARHLHFTNKECKQLKGRTRETFTR